MKKQEYVKLIILFIFTIFTYIPTFIWMAGRWTVADTYYSHGFLIPLISGFIIWQKREELRQIKIKTFQLGWLFFLTGIFIHIISASLRVYFTSGFSLILVLIGLVILLLGRDYLNKLLFPILFLIFMLPLPLVLISNLSFRLKILASQIGVFLVNNMGMYAVRDGSMIKTLHSQLMVEDPCSGIRSLIAFIALGVLMAYYSRISITKKVALSLSSIPIAIFSNVIRIVALTLASEMYGAQVATGIFHNVMGILVFVFGFLALLFIQKLLE